MSRHAIPLSLVLEHDLLVLLASSSLVTSLRCLLLPFHEATEHLCASFASLGQLTGQAAAARPYQL
jgi:hypothetical protein